VSIASESDAQVFVSKSVINVTLSETLKKAVSDSNSIPMDIDDLQAQAKKRSLQNDVEKNSSQSLRETHAKKCASVSISSITPQIQASSR